MSEERSKERGKKRKSTTPEKENSNKKKKKVSRVNIKETQSKDYLTAYEETVEIIKDDVEKRHNFEELFMSNPKVVKHMSSHIPEENKSFKQIDVHLRRKYILPENSGNVMREKIVEDEDFDISYGVENNSPLEELIYGPPMQNELTAETTNPQVYKKTLTSNQNDRLYKIEEKKEEKVHQDNVKNSIRLMEMKLLSMMLPEEITNPSDPPLSSQSSTIRIIFKKNDENFLLKLRTTNTKESFFEELKEAFPSDYLEDKRYYLEQGDTKLFLNTTNSFSLLNDNDKVSFEEPQYLSS